MIYSASLSQSGMGRSLGLTPEFIRFCECNSSGTWNKECAVFSEAFGFAVAVLVTADGVHCTNITARGPGAAVIEAVEIIERLLPN